MLLGGLQKTTLIDFPGRVACTVFTYGCNFRCGFCHNPGLVNSNGSRLDEDEFFRFLEKRKKLLDGVCITGGEPTLHDDLVEFCGKIKKMGFKIKLDTNGSNHAVLVKLLSKKLVDMVSMDVKTSLESYESVVGSKVDVEEIKLSMGEICGSGIEYELRTTVVPTIHTVGRLKRTAKQIEGVARKAGVESDKVVWIWQRFKAGNCLDEKYDEMDGFGEKEENEMLEEARRVLPGTRWR